jgi:SP family xylose:H+ symportor-like MFS transporter
MYIAEITPAKIRGRMVSVNQFAIVFGMLIVYFVNYYIAGLGDLAWNTETGWRWMFGSEAIPAVMMLILLFFVPESPRWLTKQNQKDKAVRILSKVDGEAYARQEIQVIEETLAMESGSLSQLFHPGMRVVLVIGVVLAVLQQITGINVFLYFGSEIFEKLGGESIDAALLQQVVVGAVNLLFTVIAIRTVDRIGRKPLMLIGSSGMGVALLAMGMAGYLQATSAWLLVCVLVYIASFALSVGPVTWVILSEIFPTKIRGRAMGIATICLWMANTVVSQTFPILDENAFLIERFHHGFPFFIYGLMCVVLFIFVSKVVPETKGKTLEDIEKMWIKN